MASISGASSSASTHKSIQCVTENRTKSSDTNCTSNSSCFFKRRKPMNPLAYSVMRPTQHKPNPVRQRVMSAKMIKLRQLQSQLNDANFHLSEVTRENQILKTLQKRQERAISKYESTNADLPRLIRSHEEEIRNLSERNKSLKKNVKELHEHLRLKEEELTRVKEHLNRLEKLDKDKHLIEREKLLEKVEDLKLKLQKSDDQVTSLNRKLILETKVSKQRLNTEIVKQKQLQKELMQALNEIDRLTNLLEGHENVVRPKKIFSQFGRQSMSMVHLGRENKANRTLSNERLKTSRDFVLQNPVTEVKLEPIQVTNGEKNNKNDNFMTPMENIKQRLSNGHTDCNVIQESAHKSRPSSSVRLEKLPIVGENHKSGTTNGENDQKLPEPSNEKRKSRNIKGRKEFYLNKEKTDSNSSDERDVDTQDNQSNIQKTDSLESFELNEKQFSDQQTKESDIFDFNRSSSSSEENVQPKLSSLKKNSSYDSSLSSREDIKSTVSSREDMDFKHSRAKEKPKKASSNDFSSSEEETVKKFYALDKAIRKATENSKDEFDKKLGDYCSEVVNSVKTCSKVIDLHKQSLKSSKDDTDTLLETFKNTAKIESKLKQSFFKFDDEDMGFVNEILSEEFKFKKENPESSSSSSSNEKTKFKKENLANSENKRKLLATLRAIDNGDSVESLEEKPGQTKVMKEIFGSIGN